MITKDIINLYLLRHIRIESKLLNAIGLVGHDVVLVSEHRHGLRFRSEPTFRKSGMPLSAPAYSYNRYTLVRQVFDYRL
jgi:hypothetical protein